MEKLMILDDKAKMRMGLICFIPVACLVSCFLYYLALVLPLGQGHTETNSIVGITSDHYTTLFLMLAGSAIITTPIFIYCLVILARMKTLNSAQKLMWFIFLCVSAPIASALFWLLHIRDSNKYVPIHPDIA